MAQRFQIKITIKYFSIGFYVETMSCGGGNIGIIMAKRKEKETTQTFLSIT